ncbi:hypothetical protein Tco_0909957 [Tanacetum coccineum]|uniref:Uncharacterized protein n=1 Tax=Tanacetum coccineum TaxID=301880 RepID=A0ABQ5CT83_9ASTR
MRWYSHQTAQRPVPAVRKFQPGTFHPYKDAYSSMLNSYMGENSQVLPLLAKWEEIPKAYKEHIFPTMSYSDHALGTIIRIRGDGQIMSIWLGQVMVRRGGKDHLPEECVGRQNEDEWNTWLAACMIRLDASHPLQRTDQDILDEVVRRQPAKNMSGKGRKLPGGGSTSLQARSSGISDVINREEMDRIVEE